MPQLSLHSPVGPLTFTEEADAIVALDGGWSSVQQDTPLLKRARTELELYFDGELVDFTVPISPVPSTSYRMRVWDAMRGIPFGETRTYQQLANIIGGCGRSIGQASSRNPLPILIPCHRVVAATGMGGFSMDGGLDSKRFLLTLEADGCRSSRTVPRAA